MKILILNGPNLNLLGVREKSIYGDKSFEQYFEDIKNEFPEMELSYYQSNHEGDLVDKIHEVGFDYDGVVLNAGAYTHTSVAIRDAVSAVPMKMVEVHISNIHKREEFRHHSFLTEVADGFICGMGLHGYSFAIEYLKRSSK